MKLNNNKKIFLNIFGKSFLALSLFLLSLGFIGITSVSASVVKTETGNINQNQITFNTDVKGMIYCTIAGNMYSDYKAYFSLDSSGSEYSFITLETESITGGWYHTNNAYFLNVLAGNHTIYYNSTSVNYRISCDLYDDNISSLEYVSNKITIPAETATTTTITNYKDKLIINHLFIYSGNGNNYASENFTPSQIKNFKSFGDTLNSWGHRIINDSFIANNDTISKYINFIPASSSGDTAESQYYVFNIGSAEPPIQWLSIKDYLSADVNSFFNEGVKYDFSSVFTVGPNYSLNLYCNGSLWSQYLSETDGKGTVVFNQATGNIPKSCNDATFFIYDDTNDERIGTSQEFTMYLLDVENIGNSFLKPNFLGELTINQETTPTTTLNYIYNIDENFINSEETIASKICLTSRDGGNINPSNYCNNLDETSGIGTIEMPSFSNGTRNYWRFDLINASSTVIYNGEEFTINYTNGKFETETNITTIFGDTAHNLACSENEWNATSTDWLGFNAIKTACVVKESMWTFFDKVGYGFTNIFKWLAQQITSLFPLNIPKQILNSWTNSGTTTLNNSLNFLDVAETDGTIKGYLPKQWIGTNTDLEFDIFSKNMMSQGNNAMETLFANFKIFTIFFQWVLFAWGLIYWGRDVFVDLQHRNNNIDD